MNLFEVKFPPEVETNSDFTWYPVYDGGFVLHVPPDPDEDKTKTHFAPKQQITIKQNLLDKWEIKGYIRGKRYKGERDTMAAAFDAADSLVKKIVPTSLAVIQRKAWWHDSPATPEQLKMIKRLYKGKQIPSDLTKGEASKQIGAALAGKGK